MSFSVSTSCRKGSIGCTTGGVFSTVEEGHISNISAPCSATLGHKCSLNEKEGRRTASRVRVTQEDCAEGNNTWWIGCDFFCLVSPWFSSSSFGQCSSWSMMCMIDQSWSWCYHCTNILSDGKRANSAFILSVHMFGNGVIKVKITVILVYYCHYCQ